MAEDRGNRKGNRQANSGGDRGGTVMANLIGNATTLCPIHKVPIHKSMSPYDMEYYCPMCDKDKAEQKKIDAVRGYYGE
jgi:hypothetical protein